MGQSQQTRSRQQESEQILVDPQQEQLDQLGIAPEGNQFAAEQLAAQQTQDQGGQGAQGGAQGGAAKAEAAPEQEE